jgi:hypothetical protein
MSSRARKLLGIKSADMRLGDLKLAINFMKTTSYKKLTTKECAWCDYYGTKCRKNKKCTYYKKLIKSSLKNRKKQNNLLYNIS